MLSKLKGSSPQKKLIISKNKLFKSQTFERHVSLNSYWGGTFKKVDKQPSRSVVSNYDSLQKKKTFFFFSETFWRQSQGQRRSENKRGKFLTRKKSQMFHVPGLLILKLKVFFTPFFLPSHASGKAIIFFFF